MPRYSLYQLFFVGSLFGAAIGMMITALVAGKQAYWLLAGVLLLSIRLQNLFFKPTHRRYKAETEVFQPGNSKL